jgi:hypothetical protein
MWGVLHSLRDFTVEGYLVPFWSRATNTSLLHSLVKMTTSSEEVDAVYKVATPSDQPECILFFFRQ